MASDFFYFKHFTIKQTDSAMKVGTDGVLLGCWVNLCQDTKKVLDVGTGTGIIALMIAQRGHTDLKINGVEIEPQAAKEASFNAERSPWADRISIYNDSFQNFSKKETAGSFDLIVSNPPYFNGSYKSEIAERTAARHIELLGSDDLIDGVIHLLNKESGRFAAIFPYEEGTLFIAKAATKGLYCNRICEVFPKLHGNIKRIMAEFSFKRYTTQNEKLIIATENRDYTEQYKSLTKDFYLKF